MELHILIYIIIRMTPMFDISNEMSVSIVFRGFLLREAVNYRGSARDLRFLQLRILFPCRVSRGDTRPYKRACMRA